MLQIKDKPVFIPLLIAAICFIACILNSAFGNKPIDNVVLTWENTNTLPDNWTTFRDKLWSLHIMRTIAELIALVLVTWTASGNKYYYHHIKDFEWLTKFQQIMYSKKKFHLINL